MKEVKRSGGIEAGIVVIGECWEGKPAPVVYELLGCALELNRRLNGEIAVVLLGSGVTAYAQDCIRHGADKVYAADHPALARINEEVYTDVLYGMLAENRPEIVLFPSTVHGKSIAARLAARLDTGLTADCTRLEIDGSRRMLVQFRPAYQGALMAAVICPEARPQMATVRPGMMAPAASDPHRTGRVIKPRLWLPVRPGTRILEAAADAARQAGPADIIVAAGRGVQCKAGLDLIRELAHCLGAELAATRPLVDQGWLEQSRQIGLTGRSVTGKIYVAAGISGASQHTAGIGRMDTVIAINRDPAAPIFRVADYGIVADLFEAVPLLIAKLKQKRVSL